MMTKAIGYPTELDDDEYLDTLYDKVRIHGYKNNDCLHFQYYFNVSLHTSSCSARDFPELISIYILLDFY